VLQNKIVIFHQPESCIFLLHTLGLSQDYRLATESTLDDTLMTNSRVYIWGRRTKWVHDDGAPSLHSAEFHWRVCPFGVRFLHVLYVV